jgi:hypothetical protein
VNLPPPDGLPPLAPRADPQTFHLVEQRRTRHREASRDSGNQTVTLAKNFGDVREFGIPESHRRRCDTFFQRGEFVQWRLKQSVLPMMPALSTTLAI